MSFKIEDIKKLYQQEFQQQDENNIQKLYLKKLRKKYIRLNTYKPKKYNFREKKYKHRHLIAKRRYNNLLKRVEEKLIQEGRNQTAFVEGLTHNKVDQQYWCHTDANQKYQVDQLPGLIYSKSIQCEQRLLEKKKLLKL